MAEKIRIKKGLDIPLGGKPSKEISIDSSSHIFAIYPDDFPGPVWKTSLKVGDKVKAGDILFTDKSSGKICLVAPVSGEIKEINRGERRHINFISIEKSEVKPSDFSKDQPANDPEAIKDLLKR